MSIASAIATKQQQVASAYNACALKGATMPAQADQNLTNLATTIGTIEGGAAVQTHKVYWYDYDGTVLKEDDVPDGGTSTAPTVPSHPKLTFREWVHGNTITNVKQDYFNIARHACLENGFIRKVHITEETDYSLTIWARKNNYDSVDIDWGDGTTERYSATAQNFSVSHTYATEFSGYVIMTRVGSGLLASSYNVSSWETGVEEYYFGVGCEMSDRSNLGRYNRAIKAVVLPDTLTVLYSYAFSDYSPKVIALPPTVTEIGATIFVNKIYAEYYGISAINIPSTVTTIGADAFFECLRLRFITKDIAATNLGNRCFQNTPALAMDLVFTGNVTNINSGGIFALSGIRSVSFASSSFTSLAVYSKGFFDGCANLEEVTLPQSLSITTIAGNAFSNCASLREIHNFPKNAATIGDSAFQNCYSLITPIVFENVTSMGRGVFAGCRKIKSISLAGTFTSLAPYSQGFFFDCYELESVSLPSTVSTIGNGCFRYCHNLSSLTIPANITSIGDAALADSLNMETLVISDSASTMTLSHTNISNLFNLRSLYIGSKVSISNVSAWFQNLRALEEIDCGEGWIPNQNLINLNSAPYLKASSIVTFFQHLGDNTGGTARTITLGGTNLDKLTAAEKAIATDKNYVLA